MNKSRHASVMDVFLRAAELTDDQRVAFLDDACANDPTLRAEVTSLLRHHKPATILAPASRLNVQQRLRAAVHSATPTAAGWQRELKRLPASFWLSILLGIAVLVLASWARISIQQSLKTSLAVDLATVLKADVRALRQWVQRQKSETKSWAANSSLGRLTVALTADAEALAITGSMNELRDTPAAREIARILKPLQSREGNVGATVFSREGVCLVHPKPSAVGAPFAPENLSYLQNIKLGQTILLKPTKDKLYVAEFDPLISGPVMGIAAPIRNDEGFVIGGLAVGFPSDDEYTGIVSVAQLGITGESYAFDQDFMMLSNPRYPQRLVEKGFLAPGAEAALAVKVRVPAGASNAAKLERDTGVGPPTAIVAAAVAHQDDVQVNLDGYPNYLGDRVVGAAQWLPDLGLGLCAEVAYQEAYSPVYFVSRLTWMLLGLCVVSAGATATYSFANTRMLREIGTSRTLGAYTLGELIGQGGMGKVYRAEHALLRRPTAIKVLDGMWADRETVARFEREVQLTSQLTHPNTIQIYDFGRTDDEVFYFAMEYLRGFDLNQLVAATGPLSPARTVHVMLQASASLQEAHALGLIHRDIKPANLMLCVLGGQFDFVKVLDFGIATSIAAHDARLTQDQRIAGTPAYIAPERLMQDEIDGRSDIFSLGAVAYFLLTGRNAFTGATAMDTLEQVLNATPAAPTDLAPDVPTELSLLVMDCLAKDPSDRPPDLRAVAARLVMLSAQLPWTQDDAEAWWLEHEALRV